MQVQVLFSAPTKTMKKLFAQLNQHKPAIMGILNLTPDSFIDGGKYNSFDKAMIHIENLINAGAAIIDIGAESTRPGAKEVSAAIEIERLAPIITKFKQYFDVPLSLDTKKASVAEFGLKHGVDIINDVSGGIDPAMRKIVAQQNAAIIIMHMQNKPETMQLNPTYDDVVKDIYHFFKKQIGLLEQAGIESIILDPGIGFGKSLDHNISLLNKLNQFNNLNKPIMVGTSKKSFISKITGEPENERMEGTIISNFIAIQKGATILRVHDVKSTKKVLQLCNAFKELA